MRNGSGGAHLDQIKKSRRGSLFCQKACRDAETPELGAYDKLLHKTLAVTQSKRVPAHLICHFQRLESDIAKCRKGGCFHLFAQIRYL